MLNLVHPYFKKFHQLLSPRLIFAKGRMIDINYITERNIMKITTAFPLILVMNSFASALVRYDGYQLLRVVPNNEYQLQSLQILEEETRGVLDFWRHPAAISHPVYIMVPPGWSDYVRAYILVRGIKFETIIGNVQQLIDTQNTLRQRSLANDVEYFNYNTYHTFEQISQWIDDFSDEHSHLVSVFQVAKSYEGRPVRGLKIGIPAKGNDPKPAVYFQGGIHAREWISPATVINICDKLVRDYGMDYTVTRLMETFDYYIVPLLNVDGYAYTHSTDRLWRKNRSPNRFSSCNGTDLNRNYPNHWSGEGASGDECAFSYRGDYESSEAEVQGIVNFLMDLKSSGTEFLSFVDIHSFSQMLLYPWAYSANADNPPDYVDHYYVAAIAVNDLKSVYGTIYTHGPVAKLLYPASGNSIDWAYANLSAKYSYAVELRDTGEYGFLLPEDQIEPTGTETFELVKSLGKAFLREMGMDNFW